MRRAIARCGLSAAFVVMSLGLVGKPADAQILSGHVFSFYADGSDVPNHDDILRELVLNQEVSMPMDFRRPPMNARFEPAYVYGYGDDTGRVYLGLVTGQSLKTGESDRGVAGRGLLVYESPPYRVASGAATATFTITPSWLEIYTAQEENLASFGFAVDLCRIAANGDLDDCWEQGFLSAELRGANGTVANHTYRMSRLQRSPGFPEGELTLDIFDCSGCTDASGNPLPMSEWPVEGARYDFPRHTGQIDLSVLAVDDLFVVAYTLEVLGVVPNGVESGVYAFIGDPLEVDSGVSVAPGPGVGEAAATSRNRTATCNADLATVTPDARFQVNADGTASDRNTGLQWRRCPVGYELDEGLGATLSDDICVEVGPASFSWQGALEQVAGASTPSPSSPEPWRIPNVKELASLVETACVFPARNNRVFPDAAGDITWTSTPGASGVAWTVDFGAGNLRTANQEVALSVLLVRDDDAVAPPRPDEIFANGFE